MPAPRPKAASAPTARGTSATGATTCSPATSTPRSEQPASDPRMKRDDFGIYRGYGLYIDGAWRPASTGDAREVIDPTNEEIVGWIPNATAADLDAALAAAQAGFAVWKKTSPWER